MEHYILEVVAGHITILMMTMTFMLVVLVALAVVELAGVGAPVVRRPFMAAAVVHVLIFMGLVLLVLGIKEFVLFVSRRRHNAEREILS